MGVKINISGVKASGNAKILNDAKISNGKVNIQMQETTVKDNAEVLNDMTVKKGQIDVKVKNSEIKDKARVLNDQNVEDGKLEAELNNVTIGKDTEFMNGKAEPKSRLRRFIDMLKEKDKENNQDIPDSDSSKSTDEKDQHKKFEEEISRNGELKGITPKTSGNQTKRDENQRGRSR